MEPSSTRRLVKHSETIIVPSYGYLMTTHMAALILFNLFTTPHSRYFSLEPSRHHGAPTDRRRIYIFLIRRDVLSDEALDHISSNDDFINSIADQVLAMRTECQHDWTL